VESPLTAGVAAIPIETFLPLGSVSLESTSRADCYMELKSPVVSCPVLEGKRGSGDGISSDKNRSWVQGVSRQRSVSGGVCVR
jgi:hypothetical protein